MSPADAQTTARVKPTLHDALQIYTVTVPVNVAYNSPASVSNTATISSSSDSNPGNNSTTIVISVAQLPNMQVLAQVIGKFTKGQCASNIKTIKNLGYAATSGTQTH